MKAKRKQSIGGMAFITTEIKNESFMFTPNATVPGTVPRYKASGKAVQMSDGTFEFEVVHRKKTESVLIKKFAHGRVSRCKDGGIQYTFKVFADEDIDIASALLDESSEAVVALNEYLGV